MAPFTAVAIFTLVGVGFVVMVLGISALLRPHRPHPEKLTTYECGEQPLGPAWSQFNVRYYLFCLIFVVFDVETVFLYPWALKLGWFRQMGLGPFVFGEMVVFLGILVFGLAYAWRKGALEWT